MRIRALAVAFSIAIFTAAQLAASCGSATCPLDLNALNRPGAGGFTLDLSFDYIDQNRPRIGTRSAHVGELHDEHHDEVRTINRTTSRVSAPSATRMPISRVRCSTVCDKTP